MRSKRMQPVAHHAEQKEQDAVQHFVAAQNDVADAEKQLQQLLSYREEYRQKLTEQNALSIDQVRNYRAFIDQLGLAIDQARIDVETKKQVCEQQKLAWLKCRSRSEALNLVVEKYQLEEHREQERIEQKEQDEHAQRIGNKSTSK